jgi:hypothetical protein
LLSTAVVQFGKLGGDEVLQLINAIRQQEDAIV